MFFLFRIGTGLYGWFLICLFQFLTPAVVASAQVPPHLQGGGWRTDWSQKTIDLDELQVNIARDGIPSIDGPEFVSVETAADWVSDREPVVFLKVGNTARAYPLQILMWHEIVNDRIENVPVAVTFCPLCYSALAFDRRIEGDEYHFGVSGMLRHSDLVMFDRETHSLWQQLSGEAIVGQFSGSVLKQIPAQIISFKEYRTSFPTGMVLSRETGYDRRYGRNPYEGYDDIDKQPWLFRGPFDDRLPPMEKVVAVTIDGADMAYPHSITRIKRVIHDTIEGQPIVIFHSKEGAVSALDRSEIEKSRMLGSTGVFIPVLEDGRELTFSYERDLFIDDQTGSAWDVTGRSTAGELVGRQLTPISHGDIFSFAWFVIKPDSRVYR